MYLRKGSWSTGGVQRYSSDKEKKLLRPDDIVDVGESYKMSEFFEKSPLSRAEKHPDFQVTSCHHFVTINAKFDDRWEHKIPNICIKTKIFLFLSD